MSSWFFLNLAVADILFYFEFLIIININFPYSQQGFYRPYKHKQKNICQEPPHSSSLLSSSKNSAGDCILILKKMTASYNEMYLHVF